MMMMSTPLAFNDCDDIRYCLMTFLITHSLQMNKHAKNSHRRRVSWLDNREERENELMKLKFES